MLLTAALLCAAAPASAQRFDGLNVIATPRHPFGSPSALAALAAVKRTGATAIAVVPFLWQRSAQSAELVRGEDMPDAELRRAIRDSRNLGLKVVVKPHVWLDGGWAGAVEPSTPDGWRMWFDRYRIELERIARIAAEEHADALAIGTELKKTTHRPEWHGLIAAMRKIFSGTLFYVAHNVDEAEAIAFWDRLDAIGVTLYPPLGSAGERSARRIIMDAVADRLEALAARVNKPVIVAEIGLRSAQDATAKPWESAEERSAPPDLPLQASVLADWLAVLKRPAIRGVLVWRWFTDPAAGGAADTDFTVQNKPAESVLRCNWRRDC